MSENEVSGGIALVRFLSALLGRFLGIKKLAFLKHRWKESLSFQHDGLLDRFWVDLGRIWRGIWDDLGAFQQVVGEFWTCLKRCGPAGADSVIGPPR